MKKIVSCAIVCFLISACAGLPIAKIDSKDFAISIHNNSALRRIVIEARNFSNYKICVPIENWPTKSGQIESDILIIAANAKEQMQASEFLTTRGYHRGYCPGGCGSYVIPAGKTVTTFVDYSAFEKDVTNVANDQIQFQPYPVFCDRQMRMLPLPD